MTRASVNGRNSLKIRLTPSHQIPLQGELELASRGAEARLQTPQAQATQRRMQLTLSFSGDRALAQGAETADLISAEG